MKPIEILMIEDNRGDVVLVQEAINKAGLPHRITVAWNGVDALDYLHRRGPHAAAARPDLIILDLKLPRKTGQEVLADIKADPDLRAIPLVILSSSQSELQIAMANKLPAHQCMVKPSTFDGYVALIRSLEVFRCKPEEQR